MSNSPARISDLKALGYHFPRRTALKNLKTDINFTQCLLGESAATLSAGYLHKLRSYRTVSGANLAQASRKELEALFDAVECGQGDTRGCTSTDGRMTKASTNN